MRTTAHAPSGYGCSALTMANLVTAPAATDRDRVRPERVHAAMANGGPYLRRATSAGYGGSGETLAIPPRLTSSYRRRRRGTSTFVARQQLFGRRFRRTNLQIDVNGTNYLSIDTQSLSFAKQFLTNKEFHLGPGVRSVELIYTFTASGIADGFGFTFSTSTPELSTWAMLLAGFVSLGLAAGRRVRFGSRSPF